MEFCPCGSELNYSECCEKFLEGTANAPTAEATMRARYTAFTKGRIDYIKSTYNPDELDQFDEEGVTKWAKDSEWNKLQIKNTEGGLEKDTTGVVEFIATYTIGGVKQDHREVSDFKKIDGKWYFMDGDVTSGTVQRTEPKIGRNDPCHCGSGKKFKKCCLR